MRSKIINIDSAVLLYNSVRKFSCFDIYGIIGTDEIAGEELSLLINMDDSTLTLYDSVSVDDNEWVELDVEMDSRSRIEIKIGISNSDKISLKLDFGSGGGISIREDDLAKTGFQKKAMSLFRQGAVTTDATGRSYDSIYHINGDVALKGINNDISIENANIYTKSKLIHSLIGTQELMKFNWIFDFKNKKVYAQKRKTPYEGYKVNHDKISFGVLRQDSGEVVVSSLNPKTAQYLKLYDKVIQMNGTDFSSFGDDPCTAMNFVKEAIRAKDNIDITVERDGQTLDLKLYE